MMKICDVCECDDSEENPIIEILDDNNCVEARMCMFCFVKEERDGEHTL